MSHTATMPVKTSRNRPKPVLSFRLALKIGRQPGEWGGIEINETTTTRNGTKSTTYQYLVDRIDSDWGVAYELRKMGLGHFGDEDESAYDVLLANQQDTSCSCKGWQR